MNVAAILTAKGHAPPSAWEAIAATGKARSAIRRAARDSLRRQYIELGRRLVVSAFERAGAEYSEDKLRRVVGRLSHKSVEDALGAAGRGELAADAVVHAVLPDAEIKPRAPVRRARNRVERGQNEEGWFNLRKSIGLKFRWLGGGGDTDRSATAPASSPSATPPGAIPIRGVRNDVPVKFEEGGAVPGDRIVGVLDKGHGIRIFQIHSPRLQDFEDQRWIDVTWDIDPDKPERFPAKIMVTVLNEPGTLAEIARIIGESDGNIDNLRMARRAEDFTEMLIEIEVWDLAHLNQIIAALKARPALSKVERVFE